MINSDYRTAIHEAGHAVVHRRLLEDFTLGAVTICPSGDTLGHCKTEGIWGDSSEDWAKEVIVLCAGLAAENLFGGDPEEASLGAESDMAKAQEIIQSLNLPSLDEHLSAATALLSRPENRRTVIRIANELVSRKTIQPDEVDILLAVADGEGTEEDYSRYLQLIARS